MQINEVDQAGVNLLHATLPQPSAQRVTQETSTTQLIPVSTTATADAVPATELRPFTPTTALQTSTSGLLDRLVSPTGIPQTEPGQVRVSAPTIETSGPRSEVFVRGADNRLTSSTGAVFESQQTRTPVAVELNGAGSEFAAARATRLVQENSGAETTGSTNTADSTSQGNIRALAAGVQAQLQVGQVNDRPAAPPTDTAIDSAVSIPTALSTFQQLNPNVDVRAFEQTPIIALALISIDTNAVRYLTDPNAVQAATEIDPARLVADNGDSGRSEENRGFAQADKPRTSSQNNGTARPAESQSRAAAAAFQRSTASSQSFAVNLVI